MSLTLLLDLDDTLLANNIDTFLPSYLEAFARTVEGYADPRQFVDALLAGTRQMVKNHRPDRTLQAVFEETFFKLLPVEASGFRAVAEHFYAQVFPQLQDLTRPQPGAVELVEQAMRRGYRLAIATNPLFPQAAIHHRLAWANLPVERYAFDLVSTYEAFHFAKPAMTYFAEVLAQLGWPDGPLVMVGNDSENDIAPARQLGLPSFQVNGDGAEAAETALNAGRGGLENVLPWIDRTGAEALQPAFKTPAALLAVLRSTPAALDSFSQRLPEEAWRQRPQPGEWSLTEMVCHLRDVDREVNLLRLRKVLQEENPFLPGSDTDPWAEERQYNQQDGVQALAQFTQARLEMLDLLATLPEVGWQRMARHAIFGRTNLFELVEITARHDQLHVRQAYQTRRVVAGM